MEQSRIKTWQEGYIDNYPQFSELADTQIKIFWPWNEINVEKDKHDLLTNVSASERHGIISNLKLFTKYELIIGNEHWGGRISKIYPQVGVQRMCSAFAHVELNSHAPFYNKINDVLGLSTMGFYTSYLDDPDLKGRVNFLDSMIASPDDELGTAVFSLAEGAILYSNLGYLKHFQSQGKNKIQNIVRGLNMTSRDENLHAIGGAMLYRTAVGEQKRTDYEMLQLRQAIQEAGMQIYLHEKAIIKKTFENGKQEGITEHQLEQFVKSRLNLCFDNLETPRLFTAEEVKYNPIATWFYKGVNDYQMNDFFQGVGREYSRDWDKTKFTWPKKDSQ